MKKTIIIACSILVFICLFTVFFQWRFKSSRFQEGMKSREEVYESLDDNNAFKYYMKASQSLESPDELEDIYNNYWDDPDYTGLEDVPRIEEMLEGNQPLFELVREGAMQELCRMPQGPFREYASFLADLRQVVRLHVLRAKLLEKDGEFEKATETYLNALRFAHDISTLRGSVHATVGRSLEGVATYNLFSLVNRLEDEAACRRLMEDLVNIWSDKPSLHDSIGEIFSELRADYNDEGARTALYLGELAFARGYDFESVAGLRSRVDGAYAPSGTIEYFTDTADRTGWYLWFQITKPLRLREMDRAKAMFLEACENSYHGILSAGIEKKVSRGRITQRWLKPTYTEIQGKAWGEVSRRATLIQVALRIHYLQAGEYPETLEELIPLVAEEVLVDSFSGQVFIYKRAEDGYLFYSIGRDLEDNGGEPILSPYDDIVFTFPRFNKARVLAAADNSAMKAGQPSTGP